MRGPIQAPQRPSTAAGTRPGPNAGYAPPSEMFQFDAYNQPPPARNFMPPRPGTSQGNHTGPGAMARPGTSSGLRDGAAMQRPPLSKEAQLDAYMPDFEAQPVQGQRLQDPVGLPLDGAPEAHKAPVMTVITCYSARWPWPRDKECFTQLTKQTNARKLAYQSQCLMR